MSQMMNPYLMVMLLMSVSRNIGLTEHMSDRMEEDNLDPLTFLQQDDARKHCILPASRALVLQVPEIYRRDTSFKIHLAICVESRVEGLL